MALDAQTGESAYNIHTASGPDFDQHWAAITLAGSVPSRVLSLAGINRVETMARPRVRNRILDAARILMDERGVAALTTRGVAAAAGVTEASVFNNFGDKAGFMQALLSEALPEQGQLLMAIIADSEPPQQWLQQVFSAALAYFLVVLPITAPQLGQPPVPTSADQAQGYYTPRLALSERFASLREEGRVPASIMPDMAALMVMGAAMHTALTQLTLGSGASSASETGALLALQLGFGEAVS